MAAITFNVYNTYSLCETNGNEYNKTIKNNFFKKTDKTKIL